MHRIYFISWKKEKTWIKFMNFSQKYMGSDFFLRGGVTLYSKNSNFRLWNTFLNINISNYSVICKSDNIGIHFVINSYLQNWLLDFITYNTQVFVLLSFTFTIMLHSHLQPLYPRWKLSSGWRETQNTSHLKCRTFHLFFLFCYWSHWDNVLTPHYLLFVV